MNRIKISPLASTEIEAKPEEDSVPNPSVFSSAELASAFRRRAEGEFSLFVPMHYQSSYAYPLIVWLHQDGSNCSELQQLMPKVSVRNHVAIAPQSGFAHESPIAWPNCEESVEAAYESVMAAVDHAKLRFNIHGDRIYIAEPEPAERWRFASLSKDRTCSPESPQSMAQWKPNTFHLSLIHISEPTRPY